LQRAGLHSDRLAGVRRIQSIKYKRHWEGTMPYLIRYAESTDLSAVMNLDTSLSGEQIQWKLQNKEFVIVQDGNELVGFIRLEYLWSKHPYIGLIRVSPTHQRKGIGKRLLAFVEKNLSEKGISKLYSSSQADEAEPQQWHRHVGFTECGVINGINEGVGELFFVKELT
jgi:N-acetylglutamate synthase-like GNAT family acetyltransferase